MDIKPLQLKNVSRSMVDTPSGMVTLIRLVQSVNELRLMRTTLSEMVTFVRAAQPRNAPAPMLVTPLSITAVLTGTEVSAHGGDSE